MTLLFFYVLPEESPERDLLDLQNNILFFTDIPFVA